MAQRNRTRAGPDAIEIAGRASIRQCKGAENTVAGGRQAWGRKTFGDEDISQEDRSHRSRGTLR